MAEGEKKLVLVDASGKVVNIDDFSESMGKKELSNSEFAYAIARAVAQGLSFGFADEAEAWARSAVGEGSYEEMLENARESVESLPLGYRIGAETLGSLPYGMAGVGRTLGTRALAGAAGGGLYGAGAAEEGERLGGALAGGVIGAGLSSVVPSVSQRAKELIAKNIPVTIGQRFGGGLKTLEEAATSLPLAGQVIKSSQIAAGEGFNRAAINRALEPIGEEITEGAGSVAYAKADDLIKAAYQKALGFDNVEVKFNAADVIKKHQNDLSEENIKRLQGLLNKIVIPNANKKIDGRTFKELQSEIREEAYEALTSGDYDIKRLGEVLNQISFDITEQLAKQRPDAAAMLRNADTAYSRIVPIRTATVSAIGTEGVFSPAQLQRAIARENKRQKTKLARGEAEMQPLAAAARDVIGRELPETGSAPRGMVGALAYGAAAGAPFGIDPLTMLGGAALGGTIGAMYTPAGRKIAEKAIPVLGGAVRTPAVAGLAGQAPAAPAQSAAEKFLNAMAVADAQAATLDPEQQGTGGLIPYIGMGGEQRMVPVNSLLGE